MMASTSVATEKFEVQRPPIIDDLLNNIRTAEDIPPNTTFQTTVIIPLNRTTAVTNFDVVTLTRSVVESSQITERQYAEILDAQGEDDGDGDSFEDGNGGDD